MKNYNTDSVSKIDQTENDITKKVYVKPFLESELSARMRKKLLKRKEQEALRKINGTRKVKRFKML